MSADPAPSPQRLLVELQLARLERLAQIGMEIAEEAPTASDPALTFAHVSRAVRLTLAMQTRVMKELSAIGSSERHDQRRRIHRKVERLIEDAIDDDEVGDHLAAEARERLFDTDGEDLADLPFDEAVARICGELGLEPPSPLGEKGAAKQTDEGADQQADGLRTWRPFVKPRANGPAPSADRVPRPPSPRGEKAGVPPIPSG